MYRKKNIEEPKIFKFSFLHGKDVNVITNKEIMALIEEYINKAKDVFGPDVLVRLPNSIKILDTDEIFRSEGRSLQLCVRQYMSDKSTGYVFSLDGYLKTGKDEDAPVIVLDEDTLHVFNNDEEFLKVYEEVSKESESLEDVLKNRKVSDSIISHDNSFWLSEHNPDVYLKSLVATYVLRPDNMSDEDDFQTLTVENIDGGSGDYFRIITGSNDPNDNVKFISISDANEISSILKDFEKRLNMFSKVKIS